MYKNRNLIHIIVYLFLSSQIVASHTTSYSSSEIIQSLKKLKVLGSVLYIAAHPDDENTAVITYMSKGMMTRTAYLSLTRGDGGQNLLGNEKGDLLGVIRTQELISARKIDGGKQYFTRAIDFGYSKTAKETLRNWDKEILLGDIVKVIREFKPDIIITRFSKTLGGHGHHLASAILAEEAFYAAADPMRFSEQLNSLTVWRAKRLYWNTWRPDDNSVSINIGDYNIISGESFNETAAYARSMHKTQGFGVSPNRGTQLNYFNYSAGDTAYNNLFEDIDLSWRRIEGGELIEKSINRIIKKFDFNNPDKIIPDLINVYDSIGNLENEHWKKIKQNEVQNLIKMCSGLWMESILWEPELSLGQSIEIRNTIVNRSEFPIKLNKVWTSLSDQEIECNQFLNQNEPYSRKIEEIVPNNHDYTQPFWLKNEHNGKLFSIKNEDLITGSENKPEISTYFQFEILEKSFIYEIPVVHRWNDAIDGEKFRPVVIRPDISISVDQPMFIFPNGKPHEIKVELITNIDSAEGKIYIDLPHGWKSDLSSYSFQLAQKGDKSTFEFKVYPNTESATGKAKFHAEMNNKIYTQEIVQMDYPHISHQTVLRQVAVDLIKLDVEVIPKKIGYIMGSGDEIPLTLSQLNYEILLLTDEDIDQQDLNQYDVIICGIRAFNTREELARQQKKIIDFVENGGTWIVQHNTRFGFQVNQIGPYPFDTNGRDRIAEEDAELEILVPEHQIFNYPNKITQEDFDGWVQERGLYFANSWEGKLYPLIAGSDEGESSKLGGLLYANYGKGVFIFTAYSWFRQLPAGVPGAYRLFVNMISAEGKNEK